MQLLGGSAENHVARALDFVSARGHMQPLGGNAKRPRSTAARVRSGSLTP